MFKTDQQKEREAAIASGKTKDCPKCAGTGGFGPGGQGAITHTICPKCGGNGRVAK